MYKNEIVCGMLFDFNIRIYLKTLICFIYYVKISIHEERIFNFT